MEFITNSPSYLSRNLYSFCFRMKVPKDLQNILTKKELKYSLQTGNISAAKSKARFVAGQVQLFFRDIRKGSFVGVTFSKEQIESMIKKFIQKTIQDYDQPVLHNQYDENIVRQAHWEGRTVNDEIQELDWIKDDLNLMLHTGDYSEYEKKADLLLKEESVPNSDIDKSSPEYAKLCQGLLRAEIKGIQYQQDRLRGQYLDDLEDILSNGFQKNSETIPEPKRSELPKPSAKSISQVMADFFNEGKAENRWTEKTRSEIEASLNILLGVIGDISISTISKTMMADFKKTIMKLPPNISKDKRYKGKSIQKIIEMKPKQTISVHTINKYIGRAETLFEYATTHGYMPMNPAKNMKLKLKKRSDETREAFIKDDLMKLFKSNQYQEDSFSKSYQFWCPLLALYTGARVNEIAQLYLSDFQQYDGIWCININDDGEKRLKNLASKRLVPLHPILVNEMGIINRVEKLKRQRKTRFFPELSKGRDGYGKSISAWFNNRYREICSIEKGKVFHSFRHTFATNLSHNGINDHSLKALLGHSEKGVTFEFYVKRGNAEKLHKDLVDHLDYGIDLSHLKSSKYAGK